MLRARSASSGSKLPRRQQFTEKDSNDLEKEAERLEDELRWIRGKAAEHQPTPAGKSIWRSGSDKRPITRDILGRGSSGPQGSCSTEGPPSAKAPLSARSVGSRSHSQERASGLQGVKEAGSQGSCSSQDPPLAKVPLGARSVGSRSHSQERTSGGLKSAKEVGPPSQALGLSKASDKAPACRGPGGMGRPPTGSGARQSNDAIAKRPPRAKSMPRSGSGRSSSGNLTGGYAQAAAPPLPSLRVRSSRTRTPSPAPVQK